MGGGQARRSFFGHPPSEQVSPYARGAVLASELTRALFGVALVGELPLDLERIEYTRERLGTSGLRGELAGELSARMLAPSEQP
jgi:hypothetical protein